MNMNNSIKSDFNLKFSLAQLNASELSFLMKSNKVDKIIDENNDFLTKEVSDYFENGIKWLWGDKLGILDNEDIISQKESDARIILCEFVTHVIFSVIEIGMVTYIYISTLKFLNNL